MTSAPDIGTTLLRTRRAQGISQRELGERLGVHQQQIARWEAVSYRTAPLTRIESAARALGLRVSVQAAGPDAALLAAEAPAAYGAAGPRGATSPGAGPVVAGAVTPVRDLGEIAARIRANGAVLKDRYHLDRIGVFGSFVYGEQTPESDVDLLVETEDPGGFRFVEAADFAEGVLGRHVDFVRPHLLKERLRVRVLEEALYVWTA
jgi:predicted nucleotidyltransferase/DNA-binding XRE family transcriptional regulator